MSGLVVLLRSCFWIESLKYKLLNLSFNSLPLLCWVLFFNASFDLFFFFELEVAGLFGLLLDSFGSSVGCRREACVRS